MPDACRGMDHGSTVHVRGRLAYPLLLKLKYKLGF